ncbi:MAG: Chemotaxis protein CheW [Clostridiales bacterium]|jgi:purine-binding chemotaxis protein CheW|nr:Chemotaxis protein CheW [Clostridiales bacterium]
MATTQQVIFKIEHEEYGLEIMRVNIIEKYQEPVKVPNTPDYIEGIINLRGEVIPVYSLRKKFGMVNKEIDDDTMIIITKTMDVKVGFIVDAVVEIKVIDEENVEAAPKMITGNGLRKYIKSVAKFDSRLIVLLDVDMILTEEEQASLQNVAQ